MLSRLKDSFYTENVATEIGEYSGRKKPVTLNTAKMDT